MAVVSGLRDAGRERVAVELDGERWRTLPVGVAARCGLYVGLELDRPRLRELARELRRADALSRAARALRARDHSERSLDERLARSGVREAERAAAVAALRRAGFVDDERFALSRAAALAGRGSGDALIRDDLERQGVGAERAREAVEALEPEVERARRIVAVRGDSQRTARYLASRGFAPETVEAAVAAAGSEALG